MDNKKWWQIIRDYFIIRITYQVSLLSQLRFFSKNLSAKHLEVAIGSGSFFTLCLKYAKFKKLNLSANEHAEIINNEMAALSYEDKSFDTINVVNCINSFTDINASLGELHRVLKDDGRIAINILLSIKGNSYAERLANKVNAWGIKKGLSHTPFELKAIKRSFNINGFVIEDGYIHGNSYNVIVKKQLTQNTIQSDKFEMIEPTSANPTFNYQEAFKRNIGWFKHSDIKPIKETRIATVGLGGVGGFHLMSLSRLGFEKFNVADFDQFELVNFNRQLGATMSTLGENKTAVIRDMIMDINPNTQMKILNDAITSDNIDEFLEDCDIYIDSIDVFSIDARIMLFERCRQLGIPVITAAPIGMGVSYIVFQPSEYKFTDYFNLATTQSLDEKFIKFLIGLNPTLCSSRYLAEPSAVNVKTKDTTSLVIGCELAASVAATEILKLVLGRGKTYYAPYYHLFDAYLHKHKIGYLYFGNRNPLQKIKYHILKRILFSPEK